MKEAELRKHAVCSICKKKIGHTGVPLFWTVDIKRHGIKMPAVRRQDGLTALLNGHAALSHALGPNEEMTKVIASAALTVCEECAFEEDWPVGVMAEFGKQSRSSVWLGQAPALGCRKTGKRG
jgi:hypothetical protein